jgi:DNA-binding NarL/FixJ family response regulator
MQNNQVWTELVLVDQSPVLTELLGARLTQAGYSTTVAGTPAEAVELARQRATAPPAIVLVELDEGSGKANGLDVMKAFRQWCPETAQIIYTALEPESMLLRVAWGAMGPASVISKHSPVSTLIYALDAVRDTGRAAVDPSLLSVFPKQPSPTLSASGYRRLVPHAGHAKLWQALIDEPEPPTYKQIAARTDLSVNTIRNYRDDLLPELREHGLIRPTMQKIHEFAHTVRPLLVPILEERLGNSVQPGTSER